MISEWQNLLSIKKSTMIESYDLYDYEDLD